MATSINELDSTIQKLLDDYAGDVTEVTAQVIPKVAKDGAKKLKKESPKDTGKYAKGWATKVEKGRMTTSAVIYGKSGTYQLAHLLEFGHVKRNGGRTRAIEHIAPVEEWVADEVVNQIISELS